MRHPILPILALAGAVALGGCGGSGEADVQRALDDINSIESGGLTEIMLTVADPDEAVSYFTRALDASPDRIDLMRGAALSFIRGGRVTEGVAMWNRVVAHPEATNDDRVELAGALIRQNSWDEARSTLDTIPPTHETYDRYRFEAMVADANEQWDRADSFYEIALGLTTTPGSILNNWGYSHLNRGNYAEAERLFTEALRHDPTMFTAKNNLVLARGAQRNYDLPVVPMTQVERAQLLHTLALAAIKQNDLAIGRGLLREAIDTHPQYFEEAALALQALESNVTN